MKLDLRARINWPGRILAFLAASLFILSIFLPVWGLWMLAPQYPEGLEVVVYPGFVDANMDILVPLKHFVGLKDLDTESFPAVVYILPYALVVFAVLSVVAGLVARRVMFWGIAGLAITGTITTFISIFIWLNRYTSDIDPDAPIPLGNYVDFPVFGTKHLANFHITAYLTWGALAMGAAVILLMIAGIWLVKKEISEEVSPVTLSLSAETTSPSGLRTTLDELSKSWVFGLGGWAFLCLFPLLISGIYMVFFYVPMPLVSNDSARFITNEVAFGKCMRSIHQWSAVALLIFTVAHMFRRYFQERYTKVWGISWLTGVILLVFVYFAGLSGDTLLWDEKGYWVARLGSHLFALIPGIGDVLHRIIFGSNEINIWSINHLFGLHVWLMPLLITLLMYWHFMDKSQYWKPQRMRELYYGLAFIFAVGIALGFSFDIPTEEVANYGTNPTKEDYRPALNEHTYSPGPDWYYFAWFKFLFYLKDYPQVFLAILAGTIIVMAVLPYIVGTKPTTHPKLQKLLLFLGAGGLFLYIALHGQAAMIPTQNCSVCHRAYNVFGPADWNKVMPAKDYDLKWLLRHYDDSYCVK